MESGGEGIERFCAEVDGESVGDGDYWGALFYWFRRDYAAVV